MGKPKVKSVTGNAYNRLGNRNHIENLSFYQAVDYDASAKGTEIVFSSYSSANHIMNVSKE
ncbi:hypothetical protein PPOP_1183 [Paenibacillus popilliae ATCC 14706]|uniref:Uncharacterized protein n=1 Tax=Paenibacillus popilliae ATCC 14706 TaxID=1212764 RepID=M9LNB5_PAEPP|nr:hypothetical protein PPOP_1183 [Paenibacillus popilliae ATCC 14706]